MSALPTTPKSFVLLSRSSSLNHPSIDLESLKDVEVLPRLITNLLNLLRWEWEVISKVMFVRE